jgi:hypothetical protein
VGEVNKKFHTADKYLGLLKHIIWNRLPTNRWSIVLADCSFKKKGRYKMLQQRSIWWRVDWANGFHLRVASSCTLIHKFYSAQIPCKNLHIFYILWFKKKEVMAMKSWGTWLKLWFFRSKHCAWYFYVFIYLNIIYYTKKGQIKVCLS